jgi:hypothetical protein
MLKKYAKRGAANLVRCEILEFYIVRCGAVRSNSCKGCL